MRFPWSVLVSALVGMVVAVACVPASDELPPAGAAGFLTVPSAAARGEPLTTADGWTVVFDRLVVQAVVQVYPKSIGKSSFSYKSGESWLWDGSRSVQIFTRELQLGTWEAQGRLESSYIPTDDEGSFEHDNRTIVGVSSADEARFRTLPDVGHSGNRGSGGEPGPSVLVALRAEKAGRVVELDLSLGGLTMLDDERVLRQVRADAVDVGPLNVQPELLLAADSGALLRFDPIAAADTDGDGRVTPAELDAAPPGESSSEVTAKSLSDTLVLRCNQILVMPGATLIDDAENAPEGPPSEWDLP